MFEKIINLDTDLFYTINHSQFGIGDYIFTALSARWSWAVILVFAFVIINLHKKAKTWIFVLIGIGLCFLIADKLTVNIIKEIVMRTRPCNFLDNVWLIEGYKPNSSSFVSAHAATAFAVAKFMSLCCKNKYFSILIFCWAVLVCYSRVYLGVHYPGDVIGGALFGILCGWLAFFALSHLANDSISKRKKIIT